MSTSEVDSRNIAISMRKSVENLVISSQDAIGQSISQALTFSGVITQHNQIVHENKSVSRSPSPSLRHTDSTLDILDDKSSECSLHVASDIPSIVDGNLAPPSLKSDTKVTSAQNPRSADGGTARTKKKSWYNALYPTYKSKSDDFKRLFKGLPDDERLIVDYSCALQKDILAHGRLYASQRYLCFHASIFGWETSLALRWKDVTAITKEKTALVIPNAILVCTEGEKNFLTSFSGRDKAYLMLFRIWQNALMDQPVTSQEIWQWVHTCYGEELGFNSDDEGYARDFPDDPPPLPDTSEEAIDSSSMEASGGAGDSRPADNSPPRALRGGARDDEGGDALPTDMSDSSDSEPDKPHNPGEAEKCTSSHEGRLLLRQEFPFNIDQMFTMIFTNSKFNLELLAARGTTDYVQAPWQPQNGLKCRQINYTLGLTSGPIGPKEVHVTEMQVMNKCSKPGALYSIDASSENAGIPYADYFSVQVHYCLQRLHDAATRLALYGHVKYKKNMWPMIKAFLEKNTMSGLEEYSRLLESRLSAEARPAAPAARARRRRRHDELTPMNGSVSAPASAGGAGAPAAAGGGGRGGVLLALLLAVLLLLNAGLLWTLYTTPPPASLHLDHLQDRMSSLSSSAAAQWARQLEAHARRQRGQLAHWRTALDATVTHLAKTEQALTKLLETIKPALEREKEEPPHQDL